MIAVKSCERAILTQDAHYVCGVGAPHVRPAMFGQWEARHDSRQKWHTHSLTPTTIVLSCLLCLNSAQCRIMRHCPAPFALCVEGNKHSCALLLLTSNQKLSRMQSEPHTLSESKSEPQHTLPESKSESFITRMKSDTSPNPNITSDEFAMSRKKYTI